MSNVRSSTIEKFSPTGTDLGVFASAGLDDPYGIMFDRAGNLYACNRANSTIEKFSPTGADLGVAHTGGARTLWRCLGHATCTSKVRHMRVQAKSAAYKFLSDPSAGARAYQLLKTTALRKRSASTTTT